MTLGDKLSRLRKQHNYTQEQLADIVGVSRQSISKWESDGAYPETDKLIVLSKLFHCTVDYLLNDDAEDPSPAAHTGKGRALGMGMLNYAPSLTLLVWALSLWGLFGINTVKGVGSSVYSVVASPVMKDICPVLCLLLSFAGAATLYGVALIVCRCLASGKPNTVLFFVSYALYAAVFACALTLMVQTAYLKPLRGGTGAAVLGVTLGFAALQTGAALLRGYFFDTLKGSAQGFARGVRRFGGWFWAKRVITFSVTAALIVCLTLSVVLPATLCSPFRLSVVDGIAFGQSRASVRKRLGKPLDMSALSEIMGADNETAQQMENVDLYCTAYARRYLKETIRIVKLAKGDMSPSDKALTLVKLAQLGSYVADLKMKNIYVEYDDNGVCCVQFDNRCEGLEEDQTKWNKPGRRKQSVKLLDTTIPFGTTPESAHLRYRVYYTDGSYMMGRTENVTSEGNYLDGWMITWTDDWGTYTKRVFEEAPTSGDMRGVSGNTGYALVALEGGGYKLILSASELYGTDSFAAYRGDIRELELQEGLKEIPDGCCEGMQTLTELVLPDSVTRIGKRAFYGCTNLQNVTFSADLREIDDSAFEGCTSLTHNWGETSLQRIGNRAFYGCTSFTGWDHLPSMITEIGDYAFYNCTRLCSDQEYAEMQLPNSLTRIGNGAFRNCTSLESVYKHDVAPDNVTIGSYAFAGCTGLTSVGFDNDDSTTVTLGTHCFDGCTALYSCQMDVRGSIPQYAFANCTQMHEFNDQIGTAGFRYVTSIEGYAFQNCRALNIMYFHYVTTIRAYAFDGCEDVSLDVGYEEWSVSNGSHTTIVGYNGKFILNSDLVIYNEYTWTAIA